MPWLRLSSASRTGGKLTRIPNGLEGPRSPAGGLPRAPDETKLPLSVRPRQKNSRTDVFGLGGGGAIG